MIFEQPGEYWAMQAAQRRMHLAQRGVTYDELTIMERRPLHNKRARRARRCVSAEIRWSREWRDIRVELPYIETVNVYAPGIYMTRLG